MRYLKACRRSAGGSSTRRRGDNMCHRQRYILIPVNLQGAKKELCRYLSSTRNVHRGRPPWPMDDGPSSLPNLYPCHLACERFGTFLYLSPLHTPLHHRYTPLLCMVQHLSTYSHSQSLSLFLCSVSIRLLRFAYLRYARTLRTPLHSCTFYREPA